MKMIVAVAKTEAKTENGTTEATKAWVWIVAVRVIRIWVVVRIWIAVITIDLGSRISGQIAFRAMRMQQPGS